MYFDRYRLGGPVVRSISNDELQLLLAAECIVWEQEVIRTAAKKYGFARSTLWKKLHGELKDLCPELHKELAKQLKMNKKASYRNHIRAKKEGKKR